MKRVVLLLVGLVAMVSMAEAQNVYIAPSKSAIAYHKSKNCSYLKNSVNVTSITTTKAKEMGRHACVRCYPELKDKTMKDIKKQNATKKTTAKKAAAEKKSTTAKKSLPERDEKGRFIKKTDTEKKTAAKKSLPERDEKGRFIKKTDAEKKSTTAKKSLPERDEKGRFIKKTDTKKSSSTKKTTKKAA